MTKFLKNDSEKPDLSLFEPLVMDLYCEASNVGAKKYGRGNWRNMKPEDAKRVLAALNRHMFGYKDQEGPHGFLRGEQCDPIEGQKHLASALWQITALHFLVEKYGYETILKEITG